MAPGAVVLERRPHPVPSLDQAKLPSCPPDTQGDDSTPGPFPRPLCFLAHSLPRTAVRRHQHSRPLPEPQLRPRTVGPWRNPRVFKMHLPGAKQTKPAYSCKHPPRPRPGKIDYSLILLHTLTAVPQAGSLAGAGAGSRAWEGAANEDATSHSRKQQCRNTCDT